MPDILEKISANIFTFSDAIKSFLGIMFLNDFCDKSQL